MESRKEDINDILAAKVKDENFDIALSGTSATLVIKVGTKIVVGWVGTTRVAIHKDDGTFYWLTKANHRPNEISEKIRIYRHRGEIREDPRTGQALIFVRARMYPGVAFSRSFGDLLSHKIGVTSEP